jgi:hypothetical protein
MIVVADSSPLRYLIVLGQAGLLPGMFGETWIPLAVVSELSTTATPIWHCECESPVPLASSEWLPSED